MNLHNDANGLGRLSPGDRLGPLSVTVSAAANERTWRAAGADHALLAGGALYPAYAATFAIMLVRAAVAPGEVLHAAQTIRTHHRVDADTPLVTTATVTERFAKRGREYAVVATETATETGVLVWSGTGTFCEV